jgi:hypothetical protein
MYAPLLTLAVVGYLEAGKKETREFSFTTIAMGGGYPSM